MGLFLQKIRHTKAQNDLKFTIFLPNRHVFSSWNPLWNRYSIMLTLFVLFWRRVKLRTVKLKCKQTSAENPSNTKIIFNFERFFPFFWSKGHVGPRQRPPSDTVLVSLLAEPNVYVSRDGFGLRTLPLQTVEIP